jgi:hypothetical protein
MNKLIVTSILCLAMMTSAFSAESIKSTSPENANAYIITPTDGQTVSQNFKVVFGLSGMGVAPAGTEKENTGHHHLLIDTTELPDMNMPLPATDHIKHFGGGQTETELTLIPGKHTLQLLLGNFAHVPHDKPVLSEKITITVE